MQGVREDVKGAKHHHDESVRERALRMYANGMSMRAISKVLQVPLGMVFTWIKRYGGKNEQSSWSCGGEPGMS
ncbi:MAG: hypothetical protein MjAS7_2162 [Metallosphaera javensis (ex Sakai et al. 2022)]|nr:MAG: hypothetical protein MjAS7_2162 [Metallosphaera javensis (ex Sakai et al. 2022)]